MWTLNNKLRLVIILCLKIICLELRTIVVSRAIYIHLEIGDIDAILPRYWDKLPILMSFFLKLVLYSGIFLKIISLFWRYKSSMPIAVMLLKLSAGAIVTVLRHVDLARLRSSQKHKRNETVHWHQKNKCKCGANNKIQRENVVGSIQSNSIIVGI